VYYGDGGTTTATSADGLLAAHSGNNLLISGNGDSILMGGTGTDVLRGGAGNDFLFGGGGTTRLEAGGGTNYLKGGAGADTFAFQATTAAHDTVVAFRPGFDTLEISAGGSAMTALDVIAHATPDAAGDAVLHLSANHDVTLQNIHVDALDSHWFHVA
jgi:Ca2+-binding RTX toxin-like protein